MRCGFKASQAETLVDNDAIGANNGNGNEEDDDAQMVPMRKMNQSNAKNRKVREFMQEKALNLQKKVVQHNLGNLLFDDMKGLENEDLTADAVDERHEK